MADSESLLTEGEKHQKEHVLPSPTSSACRVSFSIFSSNSFLSKNSLVRLRDISMAWCSLLCNITTREVLSKDDHYREKRQTTLYSAEQQDHSPLDSDRNGSHPAHCNLCSRCLGITINLHCMFWSARPGPGCRINIL